MENGLSNNLRSIWAFEIRSTFFIDRRFFFHPVMWFVIHSSVCISMQIRKSLSFPLNRLYICGCEGEGDEWRDWASRITNIQSERAARERKKIFNSFVESYWCCWRHCTPLFTIGWCRYFFFILMSNVFPVFPKSLSVREGYMWSTDKLCHMYA